ncbi:glycosyl hydrolase family 95 catalytic domain-containing protein [Flavitalea flava]
MRQKKRLQPMQIGQYGQLQEWMQALDDPKDDHRYVSHLFGLYPDGKLTRLVIRSLLGGTCRIRVPGNPVTNIRWSLMLRQYQLKTAEELQHFTGSPVDKVPAIVKGGYPILILCADADEAVPPEENTVLFEQKVKSLNGKITVMHKPGFRHHPHSLPDPAPIVGFILKEAGTG